MGDAVLRAKEYPEEDWHTLLIAQTGREQTRQFNA